MPRSLALLLPLAALLACAPASEAPLPENGAFAEGSDTDGTETDPLLAEQCDAEDYRPLLGQNIAAVTLEASPDLRIYGPTDLITQDYLPMRTNIEFDTEGAIVRVWCG